MNQVSFTVSRELYAAGFTPKADLYESLLEVRSQLQLTEAQHAGWLSTWKIELPCRVIKILLLGARAVQM